MRSQRAVFRFAMVAVLSTLCPGLIRAQDQAVSARLARIDASTSLDAASLAPWHMKMSVQLFDAKGQPAEQGLIEEWWQNPQTYRIAYTLPSYKAVELRTPASFFRTQGAEIPPLMLQLLREQVVHPMPAAVDIAGTKPEARRQKFGKAALECIMLDRPIKAAVYFPLGVFPTFCMDAGKDSLRASYDYGSQLILRNRVEDFQGRAVARAIAIDRGGLAVAAGSVFKLDARAPEDADFAAGDELERVDQPPLRVGAATMAGLLVTRVSAVYPEAARQRNATGTVILQAIVERDGRVGFVRIVASPDADLGAAAMVAVKEWVYKPYLVDGEPAAVETTMLVNFSLAP